MYRLLDAWEQDAARGQARRLRHSTTVNRATEVLRRSFVAPKGMAQLLPASSQALGRRLAAEFIDLVEG